MKKRRIDALGRLGIPKAILEEMGWEKGLELVLEPNAGEGILVLRRSRAFCVLCRGEEDLISMGDGVSLCSRCLTRLPRSKT